LLRLLATDLSPTEGSLELLGHRADRRSRAGLRRRIGFCPDTPVHFPWLSGIENVRFFSTLRGPMDEAHHERVRALLDAFEILDLGGTPVREFSFGMKRKLLLTDCLAATLPLILLDEPTVGLDPDGTRVLRRAIRTRVGEGATVVIGSNDVRELPLWANDVAFLHRGRLVEHAPRDTLLERLKGWTRIEIHLDPRRDSDLPPTNGIQQIPGVEAPDALTDPLVFRSSRGTEPLPALLSALLDAGTHVRDVRVREPDFGDVFRALTGEALTRDVLGGDVEFGDGVELRDGVGFGDGVESGGPR
jgi:ABC-type multidrug transport system ATPase subunit